VAQVDHRAHAVSVQLGPAVRRQLVHGVGAYQRAAARLAPVRGRQPAEIADVEAALPVELSRDAQSASDSGCSSS
jgi:hypothetical protein